MSGAFQLIVLLQALAAVACVAAVRREYCFHFAVFSSEKSIISAAKTPVLRVGALFSRIMSRLRARDYRRWLDLPS
jgi:hypothetical protein